MEPDTPLLDRSSRLMDLSQSSIIGPQVLFALHPSERLCCAIPHAELRETDPERSNQLSLSLTHTHTHTLNTRMRKPGEQMNVERASANRCVLGTRWLTLMLVASDGHDWSSLWFALSCLLAARSVGRWLRKETLRKLHATRHACTATERDRTKQDKVRRDEIR